MNICIHVSLIINIQSFARSLGKMAINTQKIAHIDDPYNVKLSIVSLLCMVQPMEQVQFEPTNILELQKSSEKTLHNEIYVFCHSLINNVCGQCSVHLVRMQVSAG